MHSTITSVTILNCLPLQIGRDGAFIGPTENQYAILDDDETGLTLHFMEASARDPTVGGTNEGGNNGELDPNLFYEHSSVND